MRRPRWIRAIGSRGLGLRGVLMLGLLCLAVGVFLFCLLTLLDLYLFSLVASSPFFIHRRPASQLVEAWKRATAGKSRRKDWQSRRFGAVASDVDNRTVDNRTVELPQASAEAQQFSSPIRSSAWAHHPLLRYSTRATMKEAAAEFNSGVWGILRCSQWQQDGRGKMTAEEASFSCFALFPKQATKREE